MKLFLDTSVLLTASGSAAGASHFIVLAASGQGWTLLTSPWCVEETDRNVRKFDAKAVSVWRTFLQPALTLVPTELAFDRALVFPKAKDRPVLLSALGRKPMCCSPMMRRIFNG